MNENKPGILSEGYPKQKEERFKPGRVVAAGMAAVALLGASYKLGQNSQYNERYEAVQSAHELHYNFRQNRLAFTFKHYGENMLPAVKVIKGFTSKSIGNSSDAELFDRTKKLVSAAEEVSSFSGVGTLDVLKNTVPEETLIELEEDRKIALFEQTKVCDEDTLRPEADFDARGQIKQAIVPICNLK